MALVGGICHLLKDPLKNSNGFLTDLSVKAVSTRRRTHEIKRSAATLNLKDGVKDDNGSVTDLPVEAVTTRRRTNEIKRNAATLNLKDGVKGHNKHDKPVTDLPVEAVATRRHTHEIEQDAVKLNLKDGVMGRNKAVTDLPVEAVATRRRTHEIKRSAATLNLKDGIKDDIKPVTDLPVEAVTARRHTHETEQGAAPLNLLDGVMDHNKPVTDLPVEAAATRRRTHEIEQDAAKLHLSDGITNNHESDTDLLDEAAATRIHLDELEGTVAGLQLVMTDNEESNTDGKIDRGKFQDTSKPRPEMERRIGGIQYHNEIPSYQGPGTDLSDDIVDTGRSRNDMERTLAWAQCHGMTDCQSSSADAVCETDDSEGSLAVNLTNCTDVVERQACTTGEGLALSEKRERQQTCTKIYAGSDHKGVIIQDSTNVNLSLGAQGSGTMDTSILGLKIQKTQEVFAETDKFERVNSILKREGHVTLSGASGEGKTSLALMLGVKYKKQGYHLVFVNDVDKFRLDDYISHGRKVFFIFDDIFGTVGLSTDVPQLRRILHDLQLYLENQSSQRTKQQNLSKIRVIFTTKTYNLECGIPKLEGQEFFFFTGPTVIDLTRMKAYKYSFQDKEKIFQKHKLHHDITVDFADVYDAEQTMFGFPLTCQLFFEFHAFQANPKEFFKEPLFYLRRELTAILGKKDEKSAALVLMLLCDDSMDLMNVEKEFRNTPSQNLFVSVSSLIPSVTGTGISQAARNFRGTFFTNGDIIGFSHPTIHDACACALFKIAPTFVLENCSMKFLYERLKDKSMESASVSDHLHILYVSDAYNDIIAQRLAQAIEEGNYSMSITHPILKKEKLVDTIFHLLKLKKINWFDRLLDTGNNKKTRLLHSKEDGKHLLYWAVHSHSLYLVKKVLHFGYSFSDAEIRDAFRACASCGNLQVMKVLVSKYKGLFHQSIIHRALTTATENNYSSMVKYLLKYCHDVTKLPINLLLLAHEKSYLSVEKYILYSVCNKNNIICESNIAQELLLTGCRQGSMSLVLFVLPVCDVNMQIDGCTPVMVAAQCGWRHIFNLLVADGADLKLTDSNGDTVLHHACQGGNISIVNHLLPLFRINVKSSDGCTPVLLAALNGSPGVFKLLKTKGADLKLTDFNGGNVLHYASQGGSCDIVKELLPLFDINVRREDGRTPVMIAALYGRKDVFDLLVSRGADFKLEDNDGDNVLHYACAGGYTYFVHQLLPFLSVNIRRDDGRTPIMVAALNGHRDVFALLVSKGADLRLTDNNGDSVLHYASQGGKTYIVDYLIPHIDINLRRHDGRTPVMMAALCGQNRVFDLLVSKGADLELVDSNGNNVLDCASHSGNTYIVDELIPLLGTSIN